PCVCRLESSEERVCEHSSIMSDMGARNFRKKGYFELTDVFFMLSGAGLEDPHILTDASDKLVDTPYGKVEHIFRGSDFASFTPYAIVLQFIIVFLHYRSCDRIFE